MKRQPKSRIRTYSELRRLETFEERYEYLKLAGNVGEATFGFDRYLNQMLYKSKRWLQVRDEVIVRDQACDLGVIGYEVQGTILVHHMNPITFEDIESGSEIVYDINALISTTPITHRAIHYGSIALLPKLPIERRPGDTCPWR